MAGPNRGTVTRNTGASEEGATIQIENGVVEKTRSEPGKTGSESGLKVNPTVNPMEQFASVTYLWTLAALPPDQFNDANSYRNSPSDLKHVILASAGRFDAQRVKFQGGAPEFFIDNFEMDAFITASEKTGNSNAISFSFDVVEPYSVGLFLQSLQLATLEAGYRNYLEAAFVLRLDFLGYKDNGGVFQGLAPKFFAMGIREVKFDVDESGSRYQVKAIPYNHLGFSNVVDRVYSDIAIVGENVKEALSEGDKSLVNTINQFELDAVKDGTQKYPDIYSIEFPKEYSEQIGGATSTASQGRRATVNPEAVVGRKVGTNSITSNLEFGDNDISASSFGFTPGGGGNTLFPREGDVYDAETGKVKRNEMVIDPTRRQFQFPQNDSITKIINKMILSSKYAKDAITKPPSAEGFIKWWKIDVQTEILEFDDIRGVYAKKIKFRVVPYNVHISIFSSTTSPVPGLDELEKLITKRYDYIYTGQNNSVLKFDIRINNLFFTGLNPSKESNTGDAQNPDQRGVTEETPKTPVKNQNPETAVATQSSNTGGPRAQKDPNLIKQPGSPSGDLTPEELVARNFHQAFLNNSGDLINVDLEIVGDPYWMVDSGIGGYFSPPSAGNELLTQDGTMNYEGSDVYIYVSLKTPNDINPDTGLYDFANSGAESPFSGIYKVTKVKNTFNEGQFTQALKCIRMPRQALDYDGKQPIVSSNVPAITFEGQEKPKTSPVADDITSNGPF